MLELYGNNCLSDLQKRISFKMFKQFPTLFSLFRDYNPQKGLILGLQSPNHDKQKIKGHSAK